MRKLTLSRLLFILHGFISVISFSGITIDSDSFLRDIEMLENLAHGLFIGSLLAGLFYPYVSFLVTLLSLFFSIKYIREGKERRLFSIVILLTVIFQLLVLLTAKQAYELMASL